MCLPTSGVQLLRVWVLHLCVGYPARLFDLCLLPRKREVDSVSSPVYHYFKGNNGDLVCPRCGPVIFNQIVMVDVDSKVKCCNCETELQSRDETTWLPCPSEEDIALAGAILMAHPEAECADDVWHVYIPGHLDLQKRLPVLNAHDGLAAWFTLEGRKRMAGDAQLVWMHPTPCDPGECSHDPNSGGNCPIHSGHWDECDESDPGAKPYTKCNAPGEEHWQPHDEASA